jgi:hypothetical protein
MALILSTSYRSRRHTNALSAWRKRDVKSRFPAITQRQGTEININDFPCGLLFPPSPAPFHAPIKIKQALTRGFGGAAPDGQATAPGAGIVQATSRSIASARGLPTSGIAIMIGIEGILLLKCGNCRR